MTDSQFLVLLATIWIAPHADKWYSRGMSMLFCAVWLVLKWTQ